MNLHLPLPSSSRRLNRGHADTEDMLCATGEVASFPWAERNKTGPAAHRHTLSHGSNIEFSVGRHILKLTGRW